MSEDLQVELPSSNLQTDKYTWETGAKGQEEKGGGVNEMRPRLTGVGILEAG